MRKELMLIGLLIGTCPFAVAEVSIGLNISAFPDLVPVPGYPVYYAPNTQANYFFYDGLYWVFQGDNWYSSTWYNGPWNQVDPFLVPSFVLRVPVSYYQRAPSFFLGWQRNAAPHWNEHWGNDWGQRRQDWNRWDHKATPARPPLPTYQRKFAGTNYPSGVQQQQLHTQNFHYQPQDPLVRQQWRQNPAGGWEAPPNAVPHPMPQPNRPAPDRAAPGHPHQGGPANAGQQHANDHRPPGQTADSPHDRQQAQRPQQNGQSSPRDQVRPDNAQQRSPLSHQAGNGQGRPPAERPQGHGEREGAGTEGAAHNR